MRGGGALLSLILIFSFLIFPFINSKPNSNSYVDTTSSNAYTNVGRLDLTTASSTGKTMDGGTLESLYEALGGTGSTYDTLKTTVSSATESYGSPIYTATDIRTANGGNTVLVNFGGLEWQVTSLTLDTSGNLIATLWLDNNHQEYFNDYVSTVNASGNTNYYGLVSGTYKNSSGESVTGYGLYSDWSANWYSPSYTKSYPSSLYGNSYIRVVTLNNGGAYALGTASTKGYSTNGGTSTQTYSQSSSSPFAKFTMSSVSGSLTSYLVTPSAIKYQATEVYAGNTSYYLPNEAYDPTNLTGRTDGNSGWYSSYGGSNMSSKGDYTAWKDDYLWLPSLAETGKNTTYTGIWGLSNNERANYDGSTGTVSSDACAGNGTSDLAQGKGVYAYSWLRSGAYNNALINYSLFQYGYSTLTDYVYYSRAVRPALHLNLSVVSENATSLEDATATLENTSYTFTGSEIQPQLSGNVTLVVEGVTATLTQGTDFTISYKNNINVKRKDDDPSGEIEAYAQVILTGIGNYKGTKVIYFTIVPKNFADMTLDFSIENKTYNGQEQDAGETVADAG